MSGFDVIKVVGKFDFCFVTARVKFGWRAVVKLSPTGKSGLDEMTDIVIRNFFFVELCKRRHFWSRPDKRHISFEDAPKLGQFINSRLSQKLPRSSYFLSLLFSVTPSSFTLMLLNFEIFIILLFCPTLSCEIKIGPPSSSFINRTVNG